MSPNVEDLESKDHVAAAGASGVPNLLSADQDELLKNSMGGEKSLKEAGWRGMVRRVRQSLKDKGVEDRGIVPRPEDVSGPNYSRGRQWRERWFGWLWKAGS